MPKDGILCADSEKVHSFPRLMGVHTNVPFPVAFGFYMLCQFLQQIEWQWHRHTSPLHLLGGVLFHSGPEVPQLIITGWLAQEIIGAKGAPIFRWCQRSISSMLNKIQKTRRFIFQPKVFFCPYVAVTIRHNTNYFRWWAWLCLRLTFVGASIFWLAANAIYAFMILSFLWWRLYSIIQRLQLLKMELIELYMVLQN